MCDLSDSYYIGCYKKNNTNYQFLYNERNLVNLDVNSDFSKHFEKIGYSPTNIWLRSVNNKGQVAGLFSYGRYDYNLRKFVTVGEEVFFWDGHIIHIIPLPKAPTKGAFVKLNNVGSLLVYTYDTKTTFFWNERRGIQSIPGFTGHKINDLNVIIGEDDIKTPLIWKEGEVLNLSEMLGWDVSISYCYGINKFNDINNKSQILCTNPSNVVYIIEPINSTAQKQ